MTATAEHEPEAEPRPTPDAEPARVVHRFRLRFAKCGELRLVSHHDLMRCLERTLRRAELPVAKSQGFNPRPKVTFALAMGLGIEGRREVLDLELTEPIASEDVLSRLQAESPPGFDFLEIQTLEPGPARARPARVVSALFRLAIPEDRRDQARSAAADLLSRESCPYTRHRPDRTVQVDLRPFLLSAQIGADGDLLFRLKITPEGSARPEEVVDSLGLADLTARGSILIRDDLELES